MSDSEMGEMWAAHREARREKRASNTERSTQALTDAGVHFRPYNDGAHLIIQHNGKTVDFWPATGLWKPRNGTAKRGLHRLLSYLGVKKQ